MLHLVLRRKICRNKRNALGRFFVMKASIFFVLFFWWSQLMCGQKIVQKVIENPVNQNIYIDTNNCFQVDLKTSSSKQLQVIASIEGEYLKDLVVKIEEKGNDVFVSAGFLPNFIMPNDKLNALEEVSIALYITIPIYANIQLFGTNSNVNATGKYNRLKITLADGDCILKNVTKKTEVKTQNGNIMVIAESGTIKANSNYGEVSKNKIPQGESSYILNSVQGNIELNKTE